MPDFKVQVEVGDFVDDVCMIYRLVAAEEEKHDVE